MPEIEESLEPLPSTMLPSTTSRGVPLEPSRYEGELGWKTNYDLLLCASETACTPAFSR